MQKNWMPLQTPPASKNFGQFVVFKDRNELYQKATGHQPAATANGTTIDIKTLKDVTEQSNQQNKKITYIIPTTPEGAAYHPDNMHELEARNHNDYTKNQKQHLNAQPQGTKAPISVCGIPVTNPLTNTQLSPEDEKKHQQIILHYVANLFFLLGKGEHVYISEEAFRMLGTNATSLNIGNAYNEIQKLSNAITNKGTIDDTTLAKLKLPPLHLSAFNEGRKEKDNPNSKREWLGPYYPVNMDYEYDRANVNDIFAGHGYHPLYLAGSDATKYTSPKLISVDDNQPLKNIPQYHVNTMEETDLNELLQNDALKNYLLKDMLRYLICGYRDMQNPEQGKDSDAAYTKRLSEYFKNRRSAALLNTGGHHVAFGVQYTNIDMGCLKQIIAYLKNPQVFGSTGFNLKEKEQFANIERAGGAMELLLADTNLHALLKKLYGQVNFTYAGSTDTDGLDTTPTGEKASGSHPSKNQLLNQKINEIFPGISVAATTPVKQTSKGKVENKDTGIGYGCGPIALDNATRFLEIGTFTPNAEIKDALEHEKKLRQAHMAVATQAFRKTQYGADKAQTLHPHANETTVTPSANPNAVQPKWEPFIEYHKEGVRRDLADKGWNINHTEGVVFSQDRKYQFKIEEKGVSAPAGSDGKTLDAMIQFMRDSGFKQVNISAANEEAKKILLQACIKYDVVPMNTEVKQQKSPSNNPASTFGPQPPATPTGMPPGMQQLLQQKAQA